MNKQKFCRVSEAAHEAGYPIWVVIRNSDGEVIRRYWAGVDADAEAAALNSRTEAA